MIKDLLQGKPFKHPLHPFLVHFPVGLFLFSLVLDVASLIFPAEPTLEPAAFYSMGFGVATALLAAVPGFVDYLDIRKDHPARAKAVHHMLLNLAAVGLYGLNLGLRYSQADGQQVGWLPFVLSCVGVGILSVSGYLGGTIVYADGVGVGRHRRRSPGPKQTIEIKALGAAAPREPVSVAKAGALQDGETLRVKLANVVVAIARQGDEYFAFQEFCPHRYGPLSEGKIEKGTVECPWHRSCFDLATGEVKQGPAKIGLKTYKVTVRDDTLWIDFPSG
jgi:nitrite reductase/ring-hydroxylating ferredoxin subunit/uncharacterized membrane protein